MINYEHNLVTEPLLASLTSVQVHGAPLTRRGPRGGAAPHVEVSFAAAAGCRSASSTTLSARSSAPSGEAHH